MNSASGRGGAEAVQSRVTEICAAAGREVIVAAAHDVAGLRQAVEAAIASGAPAIVAGGGDGTVSCVAGYLAGRDIPLGVLPLGTLNHFAKDLGIPLGLDAAMAVVLAGRTEGIDVGEVNGRVFLNNSSLGLYPLIVRLREEHPVRGPAKWLVALWATLKGMWGHREIAVRILVEGEQVVRRTPILFISNNAYRAAGIDAAVRDSLQAGHLAIYIVRTGGGRHLFRLAWKILIGKGGEELELLHAEATTIEQRKSRVHVAVDGEVEHFEPPLEYRIRPAALRVLMPERQPDAKG